MAIFESQTNYFFIPSDKLLSIATPEEIASAEVYPVVGSVRLNIVFRKKADAKRFTDAGFQLTYVTKTQFVVNDRSIGTIGSRIIGPMSYITRVDDKYDDSMGAYQVAYGVDADGNEIIESNMYNQKSVYVIGAVNENI